MTLEWCELRYGEKAFSVSLLANCSVSDHIRETGAFYELEFLEAVARTLTPETLVLDVGAHVGNHTLYFAGVLGLAVHAFEPNPEAFERLVQNVKENDLESNVTCINAALSDREGRVAMRRSSATDSGTMTIVDDDSRSGSLAVDAVVLDDYVSLEPGPVFIKLDVEGHETRVIRGGAKFISERSPDISVEVQETHRFREVVDLLGDDYSPVDVFNATPTVVFRHFPVATDRVTAIHLAEYAIENALSYGMRRNWYLAEKERAHRLSDELAASGDGATRSRNASLILGALQGWLADNGTAHWAGWMDELEESLVAGNTSRGTRVLVVRLGLKPVPASLLSLLLKAVDLVDCDPGTTTPRRVRRFVDGMCVLDVEKPLGFGSRELGAAAVWTYVAEGDEDYGPIDAALFVGGEEAPDLEAAIRAFIDVPYVVVSHVADYVFSRLAVLVGAAQVYLDDPGEASAWDRSQIIPAEVIDGSPTSLMEAVTTPTRETQASRDGGGATRSDSVSNVLLASYYAPPATPVSVQRLAYWHRELPAISSANERPMDVEWLTATYQSRGQPGMVVVEDRGPWKVADDWFDLYRQAKDIGLDPLGISWSHYVETEINRLGGPVSTVILSGNPFHYFALGRVFKEKFGARIILDFRDPFAYNPRFKYSVEQRELAIRLESQWVSEADAVISVNDYCLDTIAPRLEIPRYVVANGFDESIVDTVAPKDLSGSHARIAYSGTVFAKLPLDDLLDALPENRFRLHHFGRDYSASQRVRDHPVAVAHGLVPYEELISNLKSCSAGVVMTSGEPSTQTTKLFDYLACDLDVIIVTNGRAETGNLHEVTEGLDGVFWVKNTSADLTRFFRRYEPTGIERPERERFSRQHQTKELFDVITRVERRE